MLFKGESAERGPRKMALQKTSTTDDERSFRPGFCERLQSSLSLSLPFHRVNHMPLWENRSNVKTPPQKKLSSVFCMREDMLARPRRPCKSA